MTATPINLEDLALEAIALASLIEGIEVLANEAGTEHQYERRARNALTPYVDLVIEKAWALTARIEDASKQEQAA